MKINIAFSGEKHTFYINTDETVASLKNKIQFVLNIPPEAQRLIYYGSPLLNDQVLRLNENEVIHLIKVLS